MNTKDVQKLKAKLEEEKAALISQLDEVGQRDPEQPDKWDVTTRDIEVDSADENEVADKLEESEGNAGIVNQLENQFKDVSDALTKIENGKYGLCEICNEPIEMERLMANPSARISLKHGHPSATK
jgi:DnaK suppressor protein